MQAQVVLQYAAPSSAHLTVEVNELVTLLERHDAGWFYASKISGEVGWLPEANVDVGTPLVALGDFAPEGPSEIGLSEGATVVGFSIENDWWYGVAGGQLGYFPATFVQPHVFVPIPISTEPDPGLQLTSTLNRGQGGIRGLFGRRSPANAKKDKAKAPEEEKSVAAMPEVVQTGVIPGAAKRKSVVIAPPAAKPSRPNPQQPNDAKLGTGGRNFKGLLPLQFALLGHNMGLVCGLLASTLGIFAVLWTDPFKYRCQVDGEPIHPIYTTGPNVVLCDVNDTSEDINLGGRHSIGIYAMILGPAIYVFENIDWSFGHFFPADSFAYRQKINLHSLFYLGAAVPLFFCPATVLVGFFCLITFAVYMVVGWRKEAGDGGRARRFAARIKEGGGEKPAHFCPETGFLWLLEPRAYCKKLRNEDNLSTVFWVGIYVVANMLIWLVTLSKWLRAVQDQEDGLRDGDLDLCPTGTILTPECEDNRNVVEHGTLSYWGPIAKASGNALNFNCSLILLPIVRALLRYLNNVGQSFTGLERSRNMFAQYFAAPITRYVPLQKNVEFHKFIAAFIFFFAFLHTVAHFFNYYQASQYTLARFAKWGWGGTTFVTGGFICWAMFHIYPAASDFVKHSNFYVFFNSHHFFFLFFFMLLLHGPVFWAWSLLPLTFYVAERILQIYRGKKPFKIVKVEWIKPVMAVYFRPLYKRDFVFKEGQYLYVSCPYLNSAEWHPFTISSASDDLRTGELISLATGEAVVEVPPPKGHRGKWQKFCPMSMDYRRLDASALLDKHEVAYNDFVSVHIKVNLNNPNSWTRKFKDYIELLNPGGSFPYYFTQRNERGDIDVGRLTGPDGQQVLAIDGPHSAPSEHYCEYGTVMLVGAGIGLTPCSSILSALLKFRWKKNFRPEILHFYWILRQSDVDGFQWFIHRLTELEYGLKRDREANQVDERYFAEINIFVTGSKDQKDVKPLKAGKRIYSEAMTKPTFTAEELYAGMLNPTVDAKDGPDILGDPERVTSTPNRFQDIFIWKGRPVWNKIFEQVKANRVDKNIGVCFCGAPVIGAALGENCRRYSSAEEDCLFTLHKENF